MMNLWKPYRCFDIMPNVKVVGVSQLRRSSEYRIGLSTKQCFRSNDHELDQTEFTVMENQKQQLPPDPDWEVPFNDIDKYFDIFRQILAILGGPKCILSFSFRIYLDSFRNCFAPGVRLDYWIGILLSWKVKRKNTNKHKVLHPLFGYIKYQAARSADEASSANLGERY